MITAFSFGDMIKIGWVTHTVIEKMLDLTVDELVQLKRSGALKQQLHWVKDPVGKTMWHFENIKQFNEVQTR